MSDGLTTTHPGDALSYTVEVTDANGPLVASLLRAYGADVRLGRSVQDDPDDLDAAVRSWLRENDEPTPDRSRHIGRIMGRVDETKQRRRLWPLNPFGRRAVHSATRTEGVDPVASRGTAILAPARVTTVLALALLVATGLAWLASQPRSLPLSPGEAGVDAADVVDVMTENLFGGALVVAQTIEHARED